jgi:hypothetical protein
MRDVVDERVRFLVNGIAVVFGVLLVGCTLVSGFRDKATPVVNPFVGAPVTAAVDGKMLVITNNSEEAIYHLVFPTDILPAIEWAPCIAPETCPADQKIDPGGEKRIDHEVIVRKQTQSITVFWWIYLEKAPGASVAPIEMDEIRVPVP